MGCVLGQQLGAGAGAAHCTVHQALAHGASPPALLPPGAAWDLINEPRCYKCGAAIQQWVAEMAPYAKSLDPNHLVRHVLFVFFVFTTKFKQSPFT